jgi:hypothetical protein
VVVERQQVVVARPERVGFPDESQRPGRVRGEDHLIFFWRGVEELQDVSPGGLDALGHLSRGQVLRVRIAEHDVGQQRLVLAELGGHVQAAAGVWPSDPTARTP